MSKELVVLVGPPGSGKSTLAKEYARQGHTYINQDIQGQLHHELFASAVALSENIVIDRLNFSKAQRARYLDGAKVAGYNTKIIVLHQPKAVCLQRCLDRTDHETIKDEKSARSALDMFFSKYERPAADEANAVEFRYPEGKKPSAIIVDLDGTLCNIDHRLDHVRKEGRKDWHSFFEGMADDTPNQWCVDIVEGLSSMHQIVYCSGRPDSYRTQTAEWLARHNLGDFRGGHLYMRPRSDSRQDSIIKEIILDFELLTRFTPCVMIDDRQQVVDMWRRRGYVCLQCHKGDF